jgi:agmatine deiminase
MAMKTNSPSRTPRALGYRMPAEWERHAAVWLAWPHDPKTFPDCLPVVEETYLQIIETLYPDEKVHLCVTDESMKERVGSMLQDRAFNLQRIHLHILNYADVWFRDYGPIFLTHPGENKLAMVHWYFNAWGQKYETHLKDTRIPTLIHKKMSIPYFEPGMVLEGGAIDVNGKGTLLTTEQCLLHPTRNPHLQKNEIEEALAENLGVRHFIWLKEGIAGDDTDGHVDDMARFVNPNTVVCAVEDDEGDENYFVLKENYELLLDSQDQDGEELNVIKLPMPGPVYGNEGRLPASYANFYIGNRTVLVPTFDHDNDERALEILQSLFPDRNVTGIRCEDLVQGLGALHCITQQQPSVNAERIND